MNKNRITVLKTFANYKKEKVSGDIFVLGDNFWLLLDKKSSKKLKKEALSFSDLTDIKDRHVSVKKPQPQKPVLNSQGYDISQFVKISSF